VTPGGCLKDGNTIDVVYNAVMTLPAVVGNPTTLPPPDYVIVDNSTVPTLSVTVTTQTVSWQAESWERISNQYFKLGRAIRLRTS